MRRHVCALTVRLSGPFTSVAIRCSHLWPELPRNYPPGFDNIAWNLRRARVAPRFRELLFRPATVALFSDLASRRPRKTERNGGGFPVVNSRELPPCARCLSPRKKLANWQK